MASASEPRPAAPEIALEIVDLVAGYGDLPVVRDFSARFETGTMTTLVGGNGAGKSTLLRAIFGTNRCFSGDILHRGRPIGKLAPWERLKAGIGFVPQGRCNFSTMTVAENLKMACHTLPNAQHAAAIAAMVDRFAFLRERWKVLAGNLSGGEQQMLETAMVMVLSPTLLLLDEPSLGLSPKMQHDVFTMARRVSHDGVTVLMVEQNVHGALQLADRAIVMELGRKRFEGPAHDVMNDSRIREAYLGGGSPPEAPSAPPPREGPAGLQTAWGGPAPARPAAPPEAPSTDR